MSQSIALPDPVEIAKQIRSLIGLSPQAEARELAGHSERVIQIEIVENRVVATIHESTRWYQP